MILCYHEVDPEWRSTLSVTPDAFRAHCEWLAEHKQVLPLADLVERLDDDLLPPRGTVAITFDDGFTGVHEYALPILADLGLPSTAFLVADTLTDRRQPVDWIDGEEVDARTVMSRSQVLELDAAGVDIQSHTSTHRDMTALDPADCTEDLRRSRETLEDLVGKPVGHLAYPRGRHNEDARRSAEEAGFDYAYSLPEVREFRGRYAVPRVGIFPGNGTGTLRTKTNRSYFALRHSPVFPLLRRLIPRR